MDTLRSPGGCPWDAAQSHESLARYLLEETYETLEAIETGDPASLREELGDLLLQVLFHARLAQELPPETRFSIEDVAGDLVSKLVRRHPHVFERRAQSLVDSDSDSDSDFGPAEPTAGDLEQSWEQLKKREKQRSSITDGIPAAQPALAYASALVERAQRNGLIVELAYRAGEETDEVGAELFALVGRAVGAGIDPETALRRTTRAYRDAIRRSEASSGAE